MKDTPVPNSIKSEFPYLPYSTVITATMHIDQSCALSYTFLFTLCGDKGACDSSTGQQNVLKRKRQESIASLFVRIPLTLSILNIKGGPGLHRGRYSIGNNKTKGARINKIILFIYPVENM